MSMDKKPLTLSEALEYYQHYPLQQLTEGDEFLNRVTGTGIQSGRFLSRRFSFTKPRIELVVSNDKTLVDIKLHYGFSGVVTLATVTREVTYIKPDQACILFVNNAKDPLSVIESQIDALVGTKGYKLPDEIRLRPIESFLTPEDKYGLTVNATIDTLSTYAELEFRVQLNYIDLRDCTDDICTYLLENGVVTEDQRHSIYVLDSDISSTPYAIRFKQHMGSQPIIQEK